MRILRWRIPQPNGLLLGYAACGTDELEVGIGQFAQALRGIHERVR